MMPLTLNQFICVGIPVAFVGFGILAKALSERGFSWSHWFLGLELMLATFTSSATQALDQIIKDEQYHNAEMDLTKKFGSGRMPQDARNRQQRIQELRGKNIGNLKLTAIIS